MREFNHTKVGKAIRESILWEAHIEVEATQNFMEVLRRQGQDIPELDDQLCHIIASGMFHGIFEVVVHDMPYVRVKHYVQQLQDFYLAGWHSMMGV